MPKLKLIPTIGEFWITGGSTIEVPAGAVSIVSDVDPTTGIRIDATGISMTVEGNEVFNIADNTTPLSVSNFVDYETLLLDDDDIPNKKYVDDVVSGGGAVASVFGRVGIITAQASDYTSSQVANVAAGNISAITVQAALNELDGFITAGDTVASVFARTGAIISANGDYTASQVTNIAAGNITAITVQAALNELDGLITAGDTVATVFSRTGAIISANGDYTASQVTNVPSGTITSITVQDAINELGVDAVNWRGSWTDGTIYSINDMVLDGDWTMIANTTTEERPSPQPNGDPVTALIDSPAWTEPSNSSIVDSGHSYTFTQSGWLLGYRLWVPETNNDIIHKIIASSSTGLAANNIIIENPGVNKDTWTTTSIGARLINVGDELSVVLETIDSSSDTQFSGGWNSGGTSNGGAPANQQWNRRSQDNIVRIDDTDLLTADRSAELLSVIPGSTIRFSLTADPTQYREYAVIDPAVDFGTYVEYGVVLIDSTNSLTSGATTIDFTVPIPSATKYVELATHWSGSPASFATVTGILEYDGVSQPGKTDSAFGVDLIFQPGSVSPDWDVVATAATLTVTDQTPTLLSIFTVATLPAVVLGGLIYVSDETGGATPAHSDGANWLRTSDNAIVS